MIIEHIKEPTPKRILKYPLLAKDFAGSVYYMHNREESTCIISACETTKTRVGKLFYHDAEKMEILSDNEYIKFIVDK